MASEGKSLQRQASGAFAFPLRRMFSWSRRASWVKVRGPIPRTLNPKPHVLCQPPQDLLSEEGLSQALKGSKPAPVNGIARQIAAFIEHGNKWLPGVLPGLQGCCYRLQTFLLISSLGPEGF